VPSQSADPSASLIAAPAPALGDELAAAKPAVPCHSPAGNSDHLTTTEALNSPATAYKADDATGEVRTVGGPYLYGYDSAGNPTLKDAG